jgi:hypothetical protein
LAGLGIGWLCESHSLPFSAYFGRYLTHIQNAAALVRFGIYLDGPSAIEQVFSYVRVPNFIGIAIFDGTSGLFCGWQEEQNSCVQSRQGPGTESLDAV